MKKGLFYILIILSGLFVKSQDTLNSNLYIHSKNNFSYKDYIIPTVLIGYGAIETFVGKKHLLSHEIHKHVEKSNHRKLPLDDYLVAVPAITPLVLNIAGIKGKNNLKDLSILLGSSLLLTTVTVQSLKHITKSERPDKSNKKSFPSSHTALAFAGAEVLWQEYKDISPWYGIGGYIIASATGFFRIYNNKHWFGDVLAGAGIGLLSTKLTYYLYSVLFNNPSDKNKQSKISFTPYIDGTYLGGGLIIRF